MELRLVLQVLHGKFSESEINNSDADPREKQWG
jgi:hypothetical protein